MNGGQMAFTQKCNNDMIMKEAMKETSLLELELALSHIPAPDQIVIRPYCKKAGSGKITKNNSRASKFRGVSKNGSLW